MLRVLLVREQGHPEFSTATGNEVLRYCVRYGGQPEYGAVWADARIDSIGAEGQLPFQLIRKVSSLLWSRSGQS